MSDKVFVLLQEAAVTHKLALRKRLYDRVVPPSVFDVTGLTEANLSHNQLKSLPQEIGRWPTLTSLDLRGNNLEELPEEIGRLTNLTHLAVDGNPLIYLPPSLGDCRKLQHFDPDLNGILNLPEEIKQFHPTKCVWFFAALLEAARTDVLELTGWRLQSLPMHVEHMCNHHTASFANNLLHSLPDFVVSWTNLKSLNLEANDLQAVPDVTMLLTGLTYLHVGSNRIESLPHNIGLLLNLQTLLAPSNSLISLPRSISNLTRCMELDCSYNQITVLPPDIEGLHSLAAFRLNHNQLKVLPDTVTCLTSLNELKLQGNPLHSLPIKFGLLPLSNLTFDAEAMKSPPLEVAKKGVEWTLHYLRRLHGSEARRVLALDEIGLFSFPLEVLDLASLTRLSVAKNSISELPQDIQRMSHLTDLSLAHNKLSMLPDSIGSLVMLRTFDVSNNTIRILPPSIGTLPLLHVLSCLPNPLLCPPAEMISSCPMQTVTTFLKALHISDTEAGAILNLKKSAISRLPSDVVQRSNLQAIVLDDTALSIFETSATQNLSSLSLKNCGLEEMPSCIEFCTALSRLCLAGNPIPDFGDSLRQLKSLTDLDVSGCPVKSLPRGLWVLTGLTNLKASDCPLLKEPPAEVLQSGAAAVRSFQRTLERSMVTGRVDLSLVGLKSLQSLSQHWQTMRDLILDGNPVKHLGKEFAQAPRLLKISAVQCDLTMVEALPTCCKDVDFRDNQLQDIPVCIKAATSLTRLRLGGNPISSVPAHIGWLVNLMDLDLSRCNLQAEGSLNQLSTLNSLHTLFLDGNNGLQLPASLIRQTGLTALKLARCGLKSLPTLLLKFPNLKQLDTESMGEELILPPPEVARRGIGASLMVLTRVIDCKQTGVLDLSSLALDSFPEFCCSLGLLQRLELQNNSFTSVPISISKLSSLTVLNLQNVPLEVLPIEIGHLTALSSLLIDDSARTSCAIRWGISHPQKMVDFFQNVCTGLRYNEGCINVSQTSLASIPGLQGTSSQQWIGWNTVRGLDISSWQLKDPNQVSLLSSLTSLSMCCCDLSNIPSQISDLSNLIAVDFRDNPKIKQLSEVLKQIPALRFIGLAQTGISSLPTWLKSMTSLETLDISYCNIKSLSSSLWLLPRLRRVMVKNCPIVSPPPAIISKGVKHVISFINKVENASATGNLHIRSLDLDCLPAESVSIRGLVEMDASYNTIQEIPAWIADFKHLEKLVVSHSALKYVHSSIRGATSLLFLDLSHNPELDSLPSTIGDLPNLRVILVNNCGLSAAPIQVSAAPSLISLNLQENDLRWPNSEVLDDPKRTVAVLREMYDAVKSGMVSFAGRKLERFPVEIAQSPDVMELVFTDCGLTNIDSRDLSGMTSLTRLRLERNGLSNLPDSLGTLIRLADLRCGSNRLKSLPVEVSALHATMTVLDLSKNKFKEVPHAIASLSRLQTLNLNCNFLEELPFWLGKSLPLLKRLLLKDNDLQSLPCSLGLSTCLSVLDLEDNPGIMCPPPCLLSKLSSANPAVGSGDSRHKGTNDYTDYLCGLLKYLRALFKSCQADSSKFETVDLSVLSGEKVNTGSKSSVDEEAKAEDLVSSTSNVLPQMPLIDDCGAISKSVNSVDYVRHLILNGQEKFTSFPKSIEALNSLQSISACSCNIMSLEEVNWAMLTSLQTMALDSNPRLAELLPIFSNSSLQHISVTCTAIESLPPAICLLPLLSLNVEGCKQLKCPPPEIVRRGLSAIMIFQAALHAGSRGGIVDLRASKLSTLPPSAVMFGNKCIGLNLSRNIMRSLPSTQCDWSSLTSCQSLDLSGNRLLRLPDGITDLTSLTLLNIEDNLLNLLPRLGSLLHLRMLSLAHNSLSSASSFTKEYLEIKSLHRLVLDGNNLGEFPPILSATTNLHILSAKDCNLSIVPRTLPKTLPALRELALSDNSISTFELDWFDDDSDWQHSLGHLRLDGNKITTLPAAIAALSGLSVLWLQGNPLPSVPAEIGYLTTLRQLRLGGGAGGSIPPEILSGGSSESSAGQRQSHLMEFLRQLSSAPKSRELHLANMGLQAVPHAVLTFAGLRVLNLDGNPLKRIPRWIKELRNLEQLSLRDTLISTIPADIVKLPSLKAVRLPIQNMTFPPKDVSAAGLQAIAQYLARVLDAERSGVLDLSGCGIDELPEEVCESYSVTALDISGNSGMQSFPASFCQLTNLTSLNTKNCSFDGGWANLIEQGLDALKEVTSRMLTCVSTGVCDLEGISIQEVPVGILDLPGMHTLTLRSCPVVSLDCNVGHCSHLTNLDLSHTGIEVLPSSITDLPLRVLDLSASFLASLPEQVTNIPSLERLRLCNLPFSNTNLESLSKLTALKHLDLKGCRIEKLPFAIGRLINLKSLDIDWEEVVFPPKEILWPMTSSSELSPSAHAVTRTHLSTVISFLKACRHGIVTGNLILDDWGLLSLPDTLVDHCAKMKSIVISNNSISEIPDRIFSSSQVHVLDASNNPISTIPFSVKYASNLKQLNLEGCPLSRLTAGLGALPDLQLHVDWAKLESPPQSIIQRGVPAVLALLRALLLGESTHTLDLRGWQLQQLPEELCEMQSATMLDVSGNSLAMLPSSISKLTALTAIDISHNSPLNALPSSLWMCTRLENISVEGCQMLGDCPPKAVMQAGVKLTLEMLRCIDDAKSSHVLRLGQTAATAVNIDAAMLMGLTELDISYGQPNRSERFSIRGSQQSLNTITCLRVQSCGLTQVPRSVCELDALQQIFLDDNTIVKGPPSLANCLGVCKLISMCRNQLDTFPTWILSCTNLQTLLLDSNPQMQEIPPGSGAALPSLITLSVKECGFAYLERSLACHSNLKSLYLDGNIMNLEALADLAQLPCIEKLSLQEMQFSIIPFEWRFLTSLEILQVDSQPYSNVPSPVLGLGGAVIVKYLRATSQRHDTVQLDLCNLGLAFVPQPVQQMTSLRVLKLDGNPLERLPSWIGSLACLNTLSVNSTPLVRLPATLGALSSLSRLELDNCPNIQSPPAQVVQKGQPACLAYITRAYQALGSNELHMQGFGLCDLPFLAVSHPTRLKVLNASSNCLTKDISAKYLPMFENLLHLDLSGNIELSYIPQTVCRLQQLERLLLTGCRLQGLHPAIGAIKTLDTLAFDQTKYLVWPSNSVTFGGCAKTLMFLRTMWEASTTGRLENVALWCTSLLPEDIAPFAEIPHYLCHSASKDGLEARSDWFEQFISSTMTERFQAECKRLRLQHEIQHADRRELSVHQFRQATDSAQQVREKLGISQDSVSIDGTITNNEVVQPEETIDGRNSSSSLFDSGRHFNNVIQCAVDDVIQHNVIPQVIRSLVPAENLVATAGQKGRSSPHFLQSSGDCIENEAAESAKQFLSEDMMGTAMDEMFFEPDLQSLEHSLRTQTSIWSLISQENSIHLNEFESAEREAFLDVHRSLHEELHAEKQSSNGSYRDDDIVETFPGQISDLIATGQLWTDVADTDAWLGTSPSKKLLAATQATVTNHETQSEMDVMYKTGIHYFDASSCRLECLPSWLSTLGPHLMHLDVSDNSLGKLPTIVGKLSHLQHLNINNCGIQSLASACLPTTLISLNAGSNQLSLCDLLTRDSTSACIGTVEAKVFSHLSRVDISHNFLQHIVINSRIPSITVLNAAANNLQALSIQPLSANQLGCLTLSGNSHLKRLPASIGLLTALETLDASECGLQELPQELCLCQKVATMNFQNNHLEILPWEFAWLCKLNSLDTRGNNLIDPPEEIVERGLGAIMLYFSKLALGYKSTKLDVAGMRLAAEPRIIFSIQQFCTIDISGCDLPSLPQSLGSMLNLHSLNVSRNLLKQIPHSISRLSSLRILKADYNSVAQLPPTFGCLSLLQVLSIQHNPLQEFPMSIGQCKCLSVLDVTGCGSLSPSVFNLCQQGVQAILNFMRTLQMAQSSGVLQLVGRQLKDLPQEALTSLPMIHTIRARDNAMHVLPDSLPAQLPVLEILDLAHNAFQQFPAAILQCITLKRVSFAYNLISTVPDGITVLQKLKSLDLQNCPLESFPLDATHRMPELEELVIDTTAYAYDFNKGHDGLSVMPIELKQQGTDSEHAWRTKLSQAQATGKLECAVMGLVSLPGTVVGMGWLTALNLAGNGLLTLPPTVSRMTALMELGVADNLLSTLPQELSSCVQLREINAADNRIIWLPGALGSLTQLAHLYLDNNPTLFPPRDIWVRGAAVTMTFLGRVARGGTPPLYTADISSMGMTTMHLPHGSLPALSRTLNLAGNALQQLPKGLDTFTSLLELNISGTKITKIPAWLCQLNRLEVMICDESPVCSLPSVIDNLSKLRHLSMKGCKLPFLPPQIQGCASLSFLDVSGNQINVIPAQLASCPSLRELRLANNNFHHVPDALKQKVVSRALSVDIEVSYHDSNT